MKLLKDFILEFNQYSVNADGDLFKYEYFKVAPADMKWYEKKLKQKVGKLTIKKIYDEGDVFLYFDKDGNHIATYDSLDLELYSDIKLT